jgi:hypothetical protein
MYLKENPPSMNSNSINALSVEYIRNRKHMMEHKRDIRWRLRPTPGAIPAGVASATAAGVGSATTTAARVESFEVDGLVAAGEGNSEGGAAATTPESATARGWHCGTEGGFGFSFGESFGVGRGTEKARRAPNL